MEPIRVAQIIDSLNAGGAEAVAVNLANELAKQEGIISCLIVSRTGGLLEKRVANNVTLFFLHKKNSLDFKALLRLRSFLLAQKINIVHAHSSSFYFPVVLKFFTPFKLIWHDHYGKKIDYKTGKRAYPVKLFAPFFDYVFAVNKDLEKTNILFFGIKPEKISYLPNFSVVNTEQQAHNIIFEGEKSNRLVCLANWRPQKDHINLLEAFKLVLLKHPQTYLYLIGSGKKDSYETEILQFIVKNELSKQVKCIGEVLNPAIILQQCGIGILSSESEGLPLAIIEYGLTGLAVVATKVGQVPDMLRNRKHAFLVPPKNSGELANAILHLLDSPELVKQTANELHNLIQEKYAANAVIKRVELVYKNLLAKHDKSIKK